MKERWDQTKDSEYSEIYRILYWYDTIDIDDNSYGTVLEGLAVVCVSIWSRD